MNDRNEKIRDLENEKARMEEKLKRLEFELTKIE